MFKRRAPLPFFPRLRQFLWPREGWSRAFAYMWQRALRSRASAHSIALGLAAGAFASASPLVGLHIAYAWLICWVSGANYLAAALGTWFGNPITFPFIWSASYGVGVWLLGDRRVPFDVANLTFGSIWSDPSAIFLPLFVPWMVGSIPVGLAIGIIIYYINFWIIRTYQQRRKIEKVSDETN